MAPSINVKLYKFHCIQWNLYNLTLMLGYTNSFKTVVYNALKKLIQYYWHFFRISVESVFESVFLLAKCAQSQYVHHAHPHIGGGVI